VLGSAGFLVVVESGHIKSLKTTAACGLWPGRSSASGTRARPAHSAATQAGASGTLSVPSTSLIGMRERTRGRPFAVARGTFVRAAPAPAVQSDYLRFGVRRPGPLGNDLGLNSSPGLARLPGVA
jgi:hypothetical protein